MNARRTFLVRCSAAAVGTLLPSRLWAASAVRRRSKHDEGCFAAFAKNIHTSFEVLLNTNELVMVTLVEAQPGQSIRVRDSRPAEDADNEKFSLIFHGPRERLLPQDTYWFHHRQLGTLNIFIVPVISRREDCYVYQAIFNRARELKWTGD